MAASAPRRASFADVLARGSADAPRSPGTQRRRPGAGPAAAVALSDALLARLSPSPAAEAARGALVAAVQAALGAAFPACLVVAFGSVPLKTYLPDGDIDLSLVGPVSDDAWPARVLQALSAQGGALGLTDAFAVHAEVKLVKCMLRGVAVDISANQLGGCGALLFLEEVDRAVGAAHLFKRSVLLVKAWAHYSARVLGAHRALLSTYALEALVLHLFARLPAAQLSTPLAALAAFLSHYAAAPLATAAVAPHGLLALGAEPLPVSDDPAEEPLLPPAVLAALAAKHAAPNAAGVPLAALPPSFTRRELHIVDPLCATNNLGRSVSKAGAARLRLALARGAADCAAFQTAEDPEAAAAAFVRLFGAAAAMRRAEPAALSDDEMSGICARLLPAAAHAHADETAAAVPVAMPMAAPGIGSWGRPLQVTLAINEATPVMKSSVRSDADVLSGDLEAAITQLARGRALLKAAGRGTTAQAARAAAHTRQPARGPAPPTPAALAAALAAHTRAATASPPTPPRSPSPTEPRNGAATRASSMTASASDCGSTSGSDSGGAASPCERSPTEFPASRAASSTDASSARSSPIRGVSPARRRGEGSSGQHAGEGPKLARAWGAPRAGSMDAGSRVGLSGDEFPALGRSGSVGPRGWGPRSRSRGA